MASLTDDSTVALDGAYDVDTFAAGSDIYAVVASASDDGLQIINLTRPADPTPVASLTDDSTVALDGAVAVDTIRIGSGIYAVSVSPNDNGLQIINLTDPADPTPVASLTDDTSVHLGGARGVAALNLGSGAYAVVASNDGLQVVEITDPADPTPVARVPNGVHAALGDASAVAASNDDGLQVVEITDPADPADPVPVAQVPNGVHAALRDASAVDTFTMNGGTYAVVATADGIVVVDLADPAGPILAGAAQDNAALYGASAVEAFHTAGHVYVAVAVPDGGGAVRIVSLGAMDSIPPAISSATWTPANRTISLVFGEPLDHTATDYTGIDILGESANLTLADISSKTAAGRTIIATLSPAQEATLGVPGMVRLYEGSVRDVSGNPIFQIELAVTLPDSIPPTISSATYAPGTGLLTITFSEPLNHTATTYPDIAVAGPIHGDAMRISMLLAFMYPDIAVAGPVHLYTLDEISVGTASDMTIEATLDATQVEAVGSAPMLYVMEGAVRDIPGNPIGAVRGLDVDVLAADAPDIIPPDMVSSYYNTGTGILNMTFSEPLNGTIHYDRMHIRDIGRSTGGLTLDDMASSPLDANSTTATLTLSDIQRQTVNAMNQPELDIEEGAVFDIAGNGVVAAPDQSVTVIDGIPPTIVSAAYKPGTGILSITFSEPLGPTVDYSGIELAGENGNVRLDDVSTKSHSDDIITATLNAAQRTAVGDATAITVSEGAVADTSGNGIAQTTIPVDMADGIPPTLVSSSYNTGTGILSIAFSEPLGPTIHYDRMHIRDIGRSTGGLTLDDMASSPLDANSTTATLTLSDIQRQTVNAMNQPELDIEAGAVADTSGNGISATPDQPITVTDGIPPTIVSVDYNTGTGILSITFSEPLDPAIDYSGVSVTGTGGSVALDDTASGHSGATITAVLDAAQRDTAGISPTLSISAGAVSDIYGNPIRQVSNFQITVEVAPVLTVPDDPPRDTAPPRLLSSYYTTGTGALNMTFNEPLRSPINYTGIILVGLSQNLTLDDVTAKNHTGMVINATLDGPQRAIVGERPDLSISAGAVSDRSGNRIPHTDGTILVIDGVPPEFVSSYYNTGTGALNVTFNEPLADIRYDLMHIRDDGQAADGLSLVSIDTMTDDPSSATMTLMLSDEQRQEVNGMTTPELDIDAGAVSDIGRNQIAAAPNRPITVIDGIAPTVDSVAYTTGRGALVVVFSEPLNEMTVDYLGVSVVGPTGSVVLDDVATKEVSGDRITATLDADQRATAGDAPRLSVSAGAVSDVAGNPILAATPAVTTIDGIPPTVILSSYNTGSGLLSIAFSEPLDSAIDYMGFTLTGPSQSVVLDDVASTSYSGVTVTATLNATQKDTAGDSPTLSVSAGAVADLHGNLILSATPNLKVIDGIPPTLASSYYNTGTGILNMTFSEPLNGDAIHYGSIAVRNTGEPTGGLSLNGVTTRVIDSSNTTLTLTLSDDQRQMVNAMVSPELDITADAVADPTGNGISAATDQSITVIDGISPTMSSAAYNTGTGVLNITFSEPLGTTIDYSGIELTGENGTVTLDVVSTKTHSNDTITATLNATQRTTVGDTMTLSVSEGAVADPTGNGIAQTTSTVRVTDGIPPTLASSFYTTGLGALRMVFSEPLGSTIDYSGMVLAGENGNVTLNVVSPKTHSDDTITATLNAAQRTTVGDNMTLSVSADAVADYAGNGILAAPNQPVTIRDGIPPTVKSASYDVNTGNLTITFSEPLSSVQYDRITVASQTGDDIINLNLATNRTVSGEVVSATLTVDQRAVVREYPVLFLDHFAVRDLANNRMDRTTSDVTVIDTISPATLSSSYNTESGVLSVTFDELLDRTLTDYSGLAVRGQSANLTFDDAYRVMTTHNTVWATLNQTQRDTVGEPATVSVSAGAVTDLYGNRAGQATIATAVTTPGLPFIDVREAATIQDGSTVQLDGPLDIGLFEAEGSTYGVVSVSYDDLVHIVNITDPENPDIVASLGDTPSTYLNGASFLDMFDRGGRTYAVVSGGADRAIQVVDVTDPESPQARGGLSTSDAKGLSVFWIAGHPYAVVMGSSSRDQLHIVNILDIDNLAVSGSIADTDATLFDNPLFANTFALYDRTYAVVSGSSYLDPGIQIIDVTDPANPTPVDHLRYNATTKIGGIRTDIFEAAGRTYVLTGSSRDFDPGIQAVDITDPDNLSPSGLLSLPSGLLPPLAKVYAADVFKSDGRIWGLVATTEGILIVDITDPANPVHTGGSDIETHWIKAFEADGRTWAAAGNSTALQIVQLLTAADIPVNLVAATYHTFDRDLAMTFDIEVSGTATDLSLLGVRDADGNILVSLASSTVAAVNRTVTVTLDEAAAASVSQMDEPTLVIDEGAVTSAYGKPIAAGNHTITVLDVFPPTVSSASYNTDGILVLRFSEPLNHTATDYSGLIISGQQGNVTLDQVDDKTAADSTIRATLDAMQAETVGTAATLAINEGAVSDLAGNGIVQTTETIEVTVLGLPIIEIKPVAAIVDDESTKLDAAAEWDLFEIGSNTYAIVAVVRDTVHIIKLTDPENPTVVSSVIEGEDGFDELDGAWGVDTFTLGNRTYAVVAAITDDGAQIIDLTDPENPTAVSSVTDDEDGFDELDGPRSVETFTIGNRTYAVVVAYTDDGAQIIDLTDPASPTAVSSVTDDEDGFDVLDGARAVDIFALGGRTYAVVPAYTDDGAQIIDLTDPASPTTVSSVTDGVGGFDNLDGAWGVDTFTIAGRTYAVVGSQNDDVQIIDLTDPASPTPVIGIMADSFFTRTGYTELDGARRGHLHSREPHLRGGHRLYS